MKGIASRLCMLGLGFGLLWMPSAGAWEADVHYGLTKWLALQTGYTEEQAEWIAGGDLGMDHSPLTDAVHATIVSACIGNDPTGSRRIHDFHFPSAQTAPGEPKDRVVKPGYVQQGGSQRSAPKIDDYKKEARFNELGEFLHALQDTWSHQGTPDFPQPPCNPRLGWGHPFARGGWACHLADLTYRWRDEDVLPMAQATYEVLVTQKPGSAQYWDVLQKRVQDFAAARSKWEKDKWFDEEKFVDRGFLQEISLPDCADAPSECPGPYPFERLIERWKQTVDQYRSWRPPNDRPAPTIPTVVTRVFYDYVDGLMKQHKESLDRLVDKAAAGYALLLTIHATGSCPAFLDNWMPAILLPGFLKGTATTQPVDLCELAVETAKAGKSEISCDQATKVLQEASTRKSTVALTGRNFDQMAAIAEARGLPPFLLASSFDSASESYFAFVRFVHLPHDSLMLTAKTLGQDARIVAVALVPDE